MFGPKGAEARKRLGKSVGLRGGIPSQTVSLIRQVLGIDQTKGIQNQHRKKRGGRGAEGVARTERLQNLYWFGGDGRKSTGNFSGN